MRLSLLAALSLFPVALFGESATAQEQEATDEASGFSLPFFRPADPAKSFEFEGEEAQRLAQEIFAVGASQVTKASVQVRKAAQWGGGILVYSLIWL